MNTEDSNWKKLEDQTDDDLSGLMNFSSISKIQSQNPLIKIKRNLLINMIWGALVCVIYVFVLIRFNYWEVRLALGIVFIFSLWALTTALKQYKDIKTAVFANGPILGEMKRQRESILNWSRSQSRVALFIYPISAAGGFILGGAIGSGKPVSVFMSKPVMWVILVVVIIVLVPLCHQLAKWMCKRSFGRHLDDLEKYIKELEAEK